MKPGDPPRYASLLERLGDVDPYRDAAAYDARYADRADDVAFYQRVAARFGGPVLELGCGDGRIGARIARDGHEVWGLDRSLALLAAMRPGVRAVAGDIRGFDLGRTFPLVIAPFNTVLHLYTRVDMERFLAAVARHLAPGGRLVFDASTPRPRDLARDPRRWLRVGPDHREQHAYEPLEQILYVTSEEGAGRTLLAHRQWFPAELEAALHYNGFAVDAVTADFRDEEPAFDADVLCWTCSRR